MKRQIVLSALLLAGCGSAQQQQAAKPTQEAQVRAVLERYDSAKRQLQPQQLCDVLSADVRRRVESVMRQHCTLVARGWIDYIPESMRMVGTRVASVRVKGNTATVTVRAEPNGARGPDIVLVRDSGKGWKVQGLPRWAGSGVYQQCVRDNERDLDSRRGWEIVSHVTIDEYTRRYCARRELLPDQSYEARQELADEVWFEMCLEGRLHMRLGATGFKAPSAPGKLQGEV